MASRPGSRSKTRATLKELTSLTKNLAKAMTSQLNRQQEPDLAGEVFKKVASRNPPVYDGKEDPASLENWIREFDKLFTAVRCDDELKINNATYYLREEADLWWSQRKESLATQEDFGWEQFKEALRTKFYPPHLRKKKCLEFTNLRMGTMTVNEYYSKFIELMSLEEVYGRAAHLFGIKGRELEVNPGDKRKGSSNGFQGGDKRQKINGGFKQGKDDKSNGNNNNRSQSENGKSKRVYYCKRCPRNHPGRDCEGNLVTCRICSKLGHREYECFQKDSASANPKPTQNQGGNGNKGLQQQVVTHNRVPPKNGNGGDNQAKTNNQGRVFVMSNREAETTAGVVTGASHSFISKTLVEKLKLGKPEFISMDIVIPSGDVINVSKLHRDVLVTIAGVEFPSDLIEFELDDLDVVMGMDWLGNSKPK
ncbi:uncharacterized protein LOC130589955 [Beta vulgaris subsp. vulgaris]|uniref:uncharacterized protein LOC130589955 n=1 Tax=Beta vulgaris subsp. vulgaris TaxID=3555 RepID=UPI002547A858|nr:uncharacterized protein LOC130589955 [Beta vulgaris subsp. vulgaris]